MLQTAPQYRVESGAIDALRLNEELAFEQTVMAQYVGCDTRTLKNNPTKKELQPALERLYTLLERVKRHLPNPRDYRAWFRASNVDFGWQSPLALIRSGQIGLVEDHLTHVETNQPD